MFLQDCIKGDMQHSLKTNQHSPGMATNINCKKKWHPSRHETQARVRKAEDAVQREKDEDEARREQRRRDVLESQISGTKSGRMGWML